VVVGLVQGALLHHSDSVEVAVVVLLQVQQRLSKQLTQSKLVQVEQQQ
jgi:hypothetical protein